MCNSVTWAVWQCEGWQGLQSWSWKEVCCKMRLRMNLPCWVPSLSRCLRLSFAVLGTSQLLLASGSENTCEFHPFVTEFFRARKFDSKLLQYFSVPVYPVSSFLNAKGSGLVLFKVVSCDTLCFGTQQSWASSALKREGVLEDGWRGISASSFLLAATLLEIPRRVSLNANHSTNIAVSHTLYKEV